jgi:hypothetical protein
MAVADAPRRKPIPDRVKVQVLLRALGKTLSRIDWSHEPALQLRAINDAGTDYKPAQLDPNYIEIRDKPDHAVITFKNNGTGRGDITEIAHVRRRTRKHVEHEARIAAKVTGETAPVPRRTAKIPARANPWPKGQKIRSRGFQRRRT